MVKERRRTTTRGDHPKLVDAINAVKNGLAKRQAAREFGIPESTIRLRMKTDNMDSVALGRKPTFSKQQEEELADYVLSVANLFYGLTPVELRRIAYEFAEANKIPHIFNKTEKMAGKDWLALFLIRNSRISLRKPENTSINRINAFNEESVRNFFSNLEKVMEKHRFPESRIYNVDETGISNVQKPVKILAPKGQKQVGIAASGERGKNVTVVCCFSASGNFVPPMFVFPRQRMSPHLQKGGPLGAIYYCSKNGWIDESLFYEWLQHFARTTKPTNNEPILLILDNHASHISIRIYNFCRKTGIILLSLPPHTSHRLQPLDLTFYSPLKSVFYRECSLYLKTKSSLSRESERKISQYELAELFNRAYVKVATMDKGISGFSAAGISPLNPDKFIGTYLEPAISEQEVEIEIAEEDGEQPDMPKSTEQANTILETSTYTDLSFENENEPQPGPSRAVQVTDISPLPGTSKSYSNDIVSKNVSKGRPKQKSEILTATPMKEKLEEAERNRETRKRKKETTKITGKNKGNRKRRTKTFKNQKQKSVRRRIEFSESETEEEADEKNLCDDDEDDDIEPLNCDVCLVCNEFGRDNEMWYRCVNCGRWSHEECSGWDSPEDYFCDLCLNKQKKKNLV